MAENDKNNFGGIAAIITALAGLLGAVAVIYNNVKPNSKTPETTQPQTISVQEYNKLDLCACVNECIKNIPNHFDSIKSDFISNQEGVQSFESKVSLPNSIDNTIEKYYLKEENEEESTIIYNFQSVISKFATMDEADVAYIELNKKLIKCLTNYAPTKNKSVYEKKSTSYLLNGNEVNLAIIYTEGDEGGDYSVELVVQSSR